MGLNSLGLGFIFTARDVASAQIQRLGRNFTAFEKSSTKALTRTQLALRQVALGAGLFIGGMVGIAGSLALANQAGEFEQGIARVAAISSIATDSLEAQKLETAALGAAIKTKFSPKEAAEGLQNFASQGFRVEEQMAALTPALRLAQAGMIPVADAASSMTSALKVFKKPASEAAAVTDKLLRITSLTSLQSEDLTLALGTVGRGAGLANQGIEEMLVSMGLVKNTGVDASVAASSVSSALQFMAKNSGDFSSKLGVSVTDANGDFRDFIDVVLDADAALSDKYPNAAKRAAAATKLFGRFGVTAFQAVSSQVETGVKDMEGNLLRGADAVTFLRDQLKNAGGTAEEFESKILGTFEGQKALLEGVVQGLAVTLGKPFAQAFKPIVSGIRDGIETIIVFFSAIPDETKETLAKLALGFFTLLTAVGGLIALKGSIALISASLGFLGVSASAVITPILVIVGVLAVAGLAFAAFRADAKRTGDGAQPIIDGFEKVKVFFRGLVQFFREGELSGAVLDELNKTENEGVKEFLGTVLDLGARIQAFFEGFSTGFQAFIADAQPVFEEFKAAMSELGDTLGFFTDDLDEAAGTPMANARRSGDDLGITFAKAAVLIVRGLTAVVNVIGLVLTVLDTLGFDLGEVITFMVEWKIAMAALNFARTISGLIAMGGATVSMSAVMGGASTALATTGAALSAFSIKLWAAVLPLAGPAGFVLAAAAAGAAIGLLLNSLGATDAVDNWIGRITGLNEELERLDELNGGLTSTRGFGGEDPFAAGRSAKLAAEQGLSLEDFQQQRIAELRDEGFEATIDENGDVQLAGRTGGDSGPAGGAAAAVAQSARPVGGGGSQAAQSAEVSSALADAEQQIAEISAQVGALADRPIEVAVMMDGEKLAEASARGKNKASDRAFAPVAAEG